MTRTEALAAGCARRPWRTVGAWVAAVVLAFVAIATLLPGALTTEGTVTSDVESNRALDLQEERFPPTDVPTELVVVRSEGLTADDPRFRARLAELVLAARRLSAVALAAPRSVSRDRHAVVIPIGLAGDEEESADRLVSLVQRVDGRDGFAVAMTGEFTTDHDFNDISQHDLKAGELQFGLPAALLILIVVFGALVAAFLPLAFALVSIAVALGLTALIAQGYDLSIFVVNMLTGMGLALGIDYCLFVLSRFREERAAGREKVEAIAASGATASRAVLFSGSAFVVAMIGLLLVPTTIMRSLAVGAIAVGVVSVVAALTLLPAVLSLIGDRVNSLRLPLIGRSARGQSAEGRFWGAIVTSVMRRPLVSLAAGTALLLAAASPLLGLHIGAAGISTLPDRLESKQGYLALTRSFPGAGAEPAEVVIDGKIDSPQVQAAIARLRVTLDRDREFGKPTLEVNPVRDLAVLRVPVSADPLSDRAVEAVRRLRSEYIEEAFRGVPALALVSGATAENIDYFDVMHDWLPIVFCFVLGFSFLLLTVAFRSVVIAATAILLNLLSVGAAYGLMTLVFQHGFAAGLFGFQQVDTIEAWVPLFLFAVLFGLSMDYQVFLLSRIRERYGRTRDTDDAVRFGISSTARLITGAALIIVAVFAGFAAGELVMFEQMGFGVAVALLVDATIVRSVLVPAAMKLLGEWNWYLPRWLGWLPRVEVEGHTR